MKSLRAGSKKGWLEFKCHDCGISVESAEASIPEAAYEAHECNGEEWIDPNTVAGWPNRLEAIADSDPNGCGLGRNEIEDLKIAAGVMRRLIKLARFAYVGNKVSTDEQPGTVDSLLQAAQDAVLSRAVERDRGAGERSMVSCVTAFNALFGTTLTVEQGWLFMAVLKIARTAGGRMRLDDYIDGSAYCALAGETAAKERGSK